MIRLTEPYKPRPIRCLGIWCKSGWRLKVYGITYNRPAPRPELVNAAKRVALDVLPQPAIGFGHYGVGFMGVHDGRGVNFVFVDWWADENELYHHVFTSPSDQPEKLEYSSRGAIACVWDLQVMAYERQAWLDAILINPTGPDLDAYLALQLDQMV